LKKVKNQSHQTIIDADVEDSEQYVKVKSRPIGFSIKNTQ